MMLRWAFPFDLHSQLKAGCSSACWSVAGGCTCITGHRFMVRMKATSSITCQAMPFFIGRTYPDF